MRGRMRRPSEETPCRGLSTGAYPLPPAVPIGAKPGRQGVETRERVRVRVRAAARQAPKPHFPATTMDPETTAVVACDFQNFILSRYDESHREALVSRARAVLDAARGAGYLVAHVAVRFRPGAATRRRGPRHSGCRPCLTPAGGAAGHAEASERNKMFGAIKRAGVLVEGSDGAAAHPVMAPQEGEPVVVKRRVGAFSTTDLAAILRARRVTHLVLLGVSTRSVAARRPLNPCMWVASRPWGAATRPAPQLWRSAALTRCWRPAAA